MQLGNLGGLICSGLGTLGVLVKQPADPRNRVFLLSCSHVLAKGGQFNTAFGDLDDNFKVIQQPAPDACDPRMNRIGLLQPDFSVFVDESIGVTTSDVALALLDPAVAADTSNIQPATGNAIANFATESPSNWDSGINIQLLGAKNPGAPGQIIGYNGEKVESIDFDSMGKVKMSGLVRYSCTNCEKGDSGGPVIDDENRLLGIHVAGSTDGQDLALFFPLGPYLTEKGLVLV